MSIALNETLPLERYGHNLTRLAQQGMLAPLGGLDAVAQRTFEVLQCKNRCNPLLLADDQARRLTTVAEIARCYNIASILSRMQPSTDVCKK